MWAMVWWRLAILVCKRGAGDEVGFGEVMLAGLVRRGVRVGIAGR